MQKEEFGATGGLYPVRADASAGSAELNSAVSQNCILQTVGNLTVPKVIDAQPIANRQYSRLQICATRAAFVPVFSFS
jgi:hypothetical protein